MNFSITTAVQPEDVDACLSTESPRFYWIIALALGLAAMSGNAIIILVNIFKRVARNSTNFIITNLAVVDFR